MTRIIYLSLLLVIPFLASAEHGRDILNGKWISPFHRTEIKVKVKRNEVRIKNLTKRGWTSFRPVDRGMFTDRVGNTIRLKNVHELTYRSNCGSDRIRFVKKGHIHHNHVCTNSCRLGYDYFSHTDNYNNHGNDGYGNHSEYNRYGDDYYGYNHDRDDRWSSQENRTSNNRRLNGKYFVREIDEYIIIEDTRDGLRAKRGNKDWVNYKQNKYRKNEYIDNRGNRYLIRTDRSITWRNKSGSISLNLAK